MLHRLLLFISWDAGSKSSKERGVRSKEIKLQAVAIILLDLYLLNDKKTTSYCTEGAQRSVQRGLGINIS